MPEDLEERCASEKTAVDCLFVPAEGRSEYLVQNTQAGKRPALVFTVDDDVESLVVEGERGMLHFETEYFSCGWPKVGLRMSEMRKDFLEVHGGWLLAKEDEDEDEVEQVESGEERYNG